MSNYSNTKATIAANVYTNHNHEVTAAMVKTGINTVVDTLIAGGFLYKGVAIPTTNPGSPDANVFYIATAPGTYTNFGSLVVNDGEVAILKYNGSWSKEVTGAATAAEVSALGQKIDDLSLGKFYGFFPADTDLPAGDDPGYAYVGASAPFAIYVFNEGAWSDSGSVYGPAEGNGEDIDTNAQGKLQFANRGTTYGMGYKILRRDASFASQVGDSDTIYEIRYDFDLGGASVTIPAGCVLRFVGGSLSNGTISCPMFDISGATKFISGGSLLWFSSNNLADYVRIFGDCHILFTQVSDGVLRKLYIESDRVSNIQVNGYCCYTITAYNCKFERVSNSAEYRFWIESFAADETINTFKCCTLYANDISTKPSDDYVKLYILGRTGSGVVATTLEDCVVENLPIQCGNLNVFGCRFSVGNNVTNNYETLHLSGWSRVMDSDFYGKSDIGFTMVGDVVDFYGADWATMENCVFHDFNTGTGSNLITIKTHYDFNGGGGADMNRPLYGNRVMGCRFENITGNGECVTVSNLPRTGQQFDEKYNLVNVELSDNTIVDCHFARLIYADKVRITNNTIIRNKRQLTNYLLMLYCGSDTPTNMGYKFSDIYIKGNMTILNKENGMNTAPALLSFSLGVNIPIHNLIIRDNSVGPGGYFFNNITNSGFESLTFTGKFDVSDNLCAGYLMSGVATLPSTLTIADSGAAIDWRNNCFRISSGRYASYDANIEDYVHVIRYRGRYVYNRTANRMELWNGSAWVNMDGSALA